MNPDDLTLKQLAKAVGAPAERWHGRCYEIACHAADLIGPGSIAVYGHYLGYVNPKGFWAKRVGIGFIQHGWVALADGRVLDPTRFSFEHEKPYIYLDENDEDYDEGGNRWRQAIFEVQPPPKRAQRIGRGPTSDHVFRGLGPGLQQRLAMMLGPREVLIGRDGSLTLTTEQVFWLANAPYATFGSDVFVVYEQISLTYGSVAIPIDNKRRAEREAGRTLPERQG